MKVERSWWPWGIWRVTLGKPFIFPVYTIHRLLWKYVQVTRLSWSSWTWWVILGWFLLPVWLMTGKLFRLTVKADDMLHPCEFLVTVCCWFQLRLIYLPQWCISNWNCSNHVIRHVWQHKLFKREEGLIDMRNYYIKMLFGISYDGRDKKIYQHMFHLVIKLINGTVEKILLIRATHLLPHFAVVY